MKRSEHGNHGHLVLTLPLGKPEDARILVRSHQLSKPLVLAVEIDRSYLDRLDDEGLNAHYYDVLRRIIARMSVRVAFLAPPQEVDFVRPQTLRKQGVSEEDWLAFAPGTERPRKTDQWGTPVEQRGDESAQATGDGGRDH